MVLETKKQDYGFEKILDTIIKTIEENKNRMTQPESHSIRDRVLGTIVRRKQ